MRNKTWKYLVVTSAIFVLSACGGGTKKQVNEDVSMDNVNRTKKIRIIETLFSS